MLCVIDELRDLGWRRVHVPVAQDDVRLTVVKRQEASPKRGQLPLQLIVLRARHHAQAADTRPLHVARGSPKDEPGNNLGWCRQRALRGLRVRGKTPRGR